MSTMVNFKQTVEIFNSLCKWKRKYTINNKKEYEDLSKEKKYGTSENFWKRRYIVALHGVAVYFLLNVHRMNMSVAIVAMVDFSDDENQEMKQPSNTSTEIIEKDIDYQNITKYNWSPKIQGGILGAGFLGYVLSLIIGGKLAETFGPKIILIIGTFISSFIMTVTPFAANVSSHFLIFVQCVRGIAQGFLLPAMTVISVNWFPSAERGLLSGLALSGLILGILVGGILSSIICDSIFLGGWPAVFYSFGGLGIFLSILQLFDLKNLPSEDSRISSTELEYILKNQENKLTTQRPPVPWKKVLRSGSTYALFFGTFGTLWPGIHYISVHASFCSTILHYSMSQTGVLISAPFLLSIVCNVSSSVLSSVLREKNYFSISQLRKSWNLLGGTLYSLCLALMIFTNCDRTVSIIGTIIGISSTGFANSGILIVPMDMTPTFAGSLNALNLTVGSLAGIILPVVCGVLMDKEQTVQQWNNFFIISIVIVMSSAICFCIFGSAEIQSYNFIDEDTSPTDTTSNEQQLMTERRTE